jgi:hypothetical protein
MNLAHWLPKIKPPNPGPFIAAFLELGMLVELMTHRANFGVLVWVAYFYFSATRAVIFFKGDD